eukprot:scaffold1830_cov227-Ochromonas_danica.AAC.3
MKTPQNISSSSSSSSPLGPLFISHNTRRRNGSNQGGSRGGGRGGGGGGEMSSWGSRQSQDINFHYTTPLPGFQPPAPYQYFTSLNSILSKSQDSSTISLTSQLTTEEEERKLKNFQERTEKESKILKNKNKKKRYPSSSVPRTSTSTSASFSQRDKRQLVRGISDYIRVFCGTFHNRFLLEDIENLLCYPVKILPEPYDPFSAQRKQLLGCLFSYFKAGRVHPIHWFDVITKWKGGHNRVMTYDEFTLGFQRYCEELNYGFWEEQDLEQVFRFLLRSPHDTVIRRQDMRFGMKRMSLSKRRRSWINQQARTMRRIQQFLNKIHASFGDFASPLILRSRQEKKTIPLAELESMLCLVLTDMLIVQRCRHADILLREHEMKLEKKFGIKYDKVEESISSQSSLVDGHSLPSLEEGDEEEDGGSVGSLLSLQSGNDSSNRHSHQKQSVPALDSITHKLSNSSIQDGAGKSGHSSSVVILKEQRMTEAASSGSSHQNSPNIEKPNLSSSKILETPSVAPSHPNSQSVEDHRPVLPLLQHSHSILAPTAIEEVASASGGVMAIGLKGSRASFSTPLTFTNNPTRRSMKPLFMPAPDDGISVRPNNLSGHDEIGFPPRKKPSQTQSHLSMYAKSFYSKYTQDTLEEEDSDCSSGFNTPVAKKQHAIPSHKADSSHIPQQHVDEEAKGKDRHEKAKEEEKANHLQLQRHYTTHLKPEEMEYLQQLVSQMDLGQPGTGGGGQIRRSVTSKSRSNSSSKKEKSDSLVQKHSIIQRYTVIRSSLPKFQHHPTASTIIIPTDSNPMDEEWDEMRLLGSRKPSAVSDQLLVPPQASTHDDPLAAALNGIDPNAFAAFESNMMEQQTRHMKTFQNVTEHFDRRVNMARAPPPSNRTVLKWTMMQQRINLTTSTPARTPSKGSVTQQFQAAVLV